MILAYIKDLHFNHMYLRPFPNPTIFTEIYTNHIVFNMFKKVFSSLHAFPKNRIIGHFIKEWDHSTNNTLLFFSNRTNMNNNILNQ